MKNRDIIEELYNVYSDRLRVYKDKIDSNLNRIKEIEIFISSLEKKDDDFKFFSPRNIEDANIDRINQEKKERDDLLKDNEVKGQVVKELEARVKQFELVLDSNPTEDSVMNLANDSDDDSNDSSVDLSFGNLTDSSHIIESSDFKLHTLNIQEKERQRIANELHDTTVQNLVHLVHSIELSSMFVDQDPIRAKLELESCAKNLKATISEIRETIFNLRPMSVSDLGFSKSIDDFMNNMMVQYPNVMLQFEVDDIGQDPDFNINLFRIIQECVVNSLKHSKSSDLVLHVKHIDNKCDIFVKDSGIGFDYSSMKNNHFGMVILEERVKILNGTIDIVSAPDKGTQIHIVIPLQF